MSFSSNTCIQLSKCNELLLSLQTTFLPLSLLPIPFPPPPTITVAAGFVCHSQCNSQSSCWGPNDTQCDGCRNFVYNDRCVAQCSDVILPPASSGILQNNGSGVCEDCDPQCLGGCVNRTVRTDISKLSHLFISPLLPTLILPPTPSPPPFLSVHPFPSLPP